MSNETRNKVISGGVTKDFAICKIEEGILPSIINLHIAEYQAITNRNTYWITMQYAIWPIYLVGVTLFFQLWDKVPHNIIIWVSFVFYFVCAFAWYFSGAEQYSNVKYIETELRPLIHRQLGVEDVKIAKPNMFWNYEPYQASKRTEELLVQEYFVLVLYVTGLFGVCYERFCVDLSREIVDIAMGITNIAFIAVLFCYCKVMKKLRLEFSAQ